MAMQNIDIVIKDEKAIVTIDLTHRGPKSASGKSVVVATTGGNQELGNTGIKLGVNAFTPVE